MIAAFDNYINREWKLRVQQQRNSRDRWRSVVKKAVRPVVSKRFYLSLVHSILALPLSTVYFTIIWTLVTFGSVGIFIFGVGFLLLFVAAVVIRLMTQIEAFLARRLLGIPLHTTSIVPQPNSTTESETTSHALLTGYGHYAAHSPTTTSPPNSASAYLYTPKPSAIKRLCDRIAAFIFCADTGYGLLYSIVKLPVAIITCGVTALCVCAFFFMFTSPFLRIACEAHLKHSCYKAEILSLGKDFAWVFWVVDSLPGTIILIVLSILLLPLFLCIIDRVSSLSHSAATIIGDADSLYDE